MFGAETPTKTSAPRIASDSVPVTSSGLVWAAIQAWLGWSPDTTSARAAVDDAVDVGHDDVLRPGVEQQLEDGGAGRTRAAHDEPHVRELLADDAQRVAQGGERDDGGAVLVVVEDGDVELLAQPRLDLEAARRRDVLEVDAGEHRGDRLDGADDLLGVGGVEADREGVDVGEPLEQRRLALHDRQRRERADVAEPEHRGAVGDDGDGVALDRQAAGVLGVLGDRQADPGDARRVDHRQVVTGADRHLGLHRQLAAEVHEERAVGHAADLDALDLAHPLDDRLGVLGVVREHGEVDADLRRPDAVTSSPVTTPPAASMTPVISLTAVAGRGG